MQVAGLYYVGLLVCCAAFVGYTAFGLALCQVSVPAGFALQPAGFAASAMVAMTSPLFLAFLPLMLPVSRFPSPTKFGLTRSSSIVLVSTAEVLFGVTGHNRFWMLSSNLPLNFSGSPAD